MASIIEGYSYDIFISYRQKDNKYDGWVTGFVDHLMRELEATFKEDISVYFDINPHDGLLETHDVDESLKSKLKCLIFIPVISRTYCDPKSFAWEHEFKAFVDQASRDLFGLKICLPNGNVANRILAIRIHELDAEDKSALENELGGLLRAIDFIYKEPGVNRPLTPDDDEKTNLNKTKYRNQINKVANAIREVIAGLKTRTADEGIATERQTDQPVEIRSGQAGKEQMTTVKPAVRKSFYRTIGTAALVVMAAILVYSTLFRKDSLEKFRLKGEISVAVMPFQNLTNDTLWNVWQDGIQNELINNLTNTEELKVRQTETVNGLIQSQRLINYASITPAVAKSISQKLDANVFIYGSIKQAGPVLRLNAQLIDSKTDEVFRTFQIEESGREEKIFGIIDSLSSLIKNYLIITVLEKELNQELRSFASTNSPEAYRYYINGIKTFVRNDYTTSRNWFLKALAIDSTLLVAKVQVAYSYGNQGNYTEAKQWALKIFEERDQMSMRSKAWAHLVHAQYFETPYEEIKYLKQLLEFDDQSALVYYLLGLAYNSLIQYDKATHELEKALALFNKWDIKPYWVYNYTALGYAYHHIGQFDKERKLYKKSIQDFPDNYRLIFRQAILALAQGRSKEAKEFIGKYISIRKENDASEAAIATALANLYSLAGIPDQAEKYYRQAISLEPENPDELNDLAFFLIDNDRNNQEGMVLIERALELMPGNYHYLETKGWGLYKLGNFQEAMELLQNAWDSRIEKAIYDHNAYLRLEESKKAISGIST